MVTGVVGVSGFLWFYFKDKLKSREALLYSGYFLFMGFGMLCAGILGHGLQAYIGPTWKATGWFFSALSIMFLQLASVRTIRDHIRTTSFTWLNRIFWAQFVVFVVVIFTGIAGFTFVQFNATFGLVGLVLPMHLYSAYQNVNKASYWIVGGIFFGLAPAVVFNNELGVSKWFNHHDISHLLMSTIVALMFVGASKIVTARLVLSGQS